MDWNGRRLTHEPRCHCVLSLCLSISLSSSSSSLLLVLLSATRKGVRFVLSVVHEKCRHVVLRLVRNSVVVCCIIICGGVVKWEGGGQTRKIWFCTHSTLSSLDLSPPVGFCHHFWICRVWVWGKILYTLVCISTPRLGLVTPAGRRALPGRVLEHPFSVSCSPVSRARPHGLVRRRATKRASFLPNELRCVVSSTAAIAIHDCPTGITDFAYEAHHGLRIVVARRLAPWLRCIIVVRCATSYNNAKQH